MMIKPGVILPAFIASHDGTNDLHAHKQKEIGHDIISMGIYHDCLIYISYSYAT